jgi:hypothetical protein
MILIVIASLIVAALIAAFVTDVRDRRSGKRIASAKEIGQAVRDSKRQTRVQMKTMRRGFSSRQQNHGQAGQSRGAPYLRSDEGPPRRGR